MKHNLNYTRVKHIKGESHMLPPEVKVLCLVCGCDYNTLRCGVVRLLPIMEGINV